MEFIPGGQDTHPPSLVMIIHQGTAETRKVSSQFRYQLGLSTYLPAGKQTLGLFMMARHVTGHFRNLSKLRLYPTRSEHRVDSESLA